MSRKIKLSLAVMVFGTFFGLLCSTLMNTALPTLMRVYHIDITQVQWVTNSYMLVNALMIPFSAYLIKRYPFRPLFLLAATIFLGGTVLGIFAPSYAALLLARIIQALGTGMMMPLVNVLAMTYAPRERQGELMGLIGLAFNFSPIIGPTLSGAILNHFSWRYLFILVVPFALLTVLLSWLFLPTITKRSAVHLNYTGLVTISFSLLLLLWGFSNISNFAQHPRLILGAVCLGILLCWAFVRTQTETDHPLISMGIFHYRAFNQATLLNVLIITTMYGNTILLPLLIQNIMHQSPLVSGMALLPGACLTGVLSPISGRLFDKFSMKKLVTIGLIIDCLGTVMQAFFDANGSVWMVTGGQTVRQLRLVLMLIPIQTQALAALPQHQIPDGVATFNTLRQVAAALGTAVITAVVTISDRFLERYTGSALIGIQVGFILCLVLLLICLVIVRRGHLGELE